MTLLVNKYYGIWKQLTRLAIGTYLSNAIDYTSFFVGKLIRFGFFLLFIASLFRFTDRLAGYTKYEAVLFFLTFNFIDVCSQALFRGIYLFRRDIQTGNFDFILSKPVNPLFYSLSRLTDIADFIFLAPIVALIVFVMVRIPAMHSLSSMFLYAGMLLVGLVIVLGIHIISASVTIWKIESENFIWVYREAMTIGRFPPEIYAAPVQLIFMIIIPIITIVAFPVKAALQIMSWKWIVFALMYAGLFLKLALFLWSRALRKYSSASS